MRRVHKLQIVLATVMAAALLSGCEGSQETSTDVNPSAGKVEATPIQSPTSTPQPTATPTPKPVRYETEDEKMTLYLPDKTWENVSDQDGIRLFESKEKGKITILHGTREELEDFVIPDSERAVSEFYQDNGISKRDFEILEYVNNSIGEIGIYRYTVEFQEEAQFEYVYSVNYVVTVDGEIFSVSGTVSQDDAGLLNQVQDAVESLQILSTDKMKQGDGEDADGDSSEANDKDGKTADEYEEDPQFVQGTSGESS